MSESLRGLVPQPVVGRGEVDQVDGMEEQRQVVPGKAFDQRGHLVGAGRAGLPGAGVGTEGLHDFGPDRDRALGHGSEPPCSGDLRADERPAGVGVSGSPTHTLLAFCIPLFGHAVPHVSVTGTFQSTAQHIESKRPCEHLRAHAGREGAWVTKGTRGGQTVTRHQVLHGRHRRQERALRENTREVATPPRAGAKGGPRSGRNRDAGLDRTPAAGSSRLSGLRRARRGQIRLRPRDRYRGIGPWDAGRLQGSAALLPQRARLGPAGRAAAAVRAGQCRPRRDNRSS